MPSPEPSRERQRAIRHLIGEPPREFVRLPGGRNSLVFRFSLHGEAFVAKFYYFTGADRRNRLKTEFDMCSFLWGAGMRRIPQPIAADLKNHIGVYRFVAGRHLPAERIGFPAIRGFGELLREIHAISSVEGAEGLPIAADGALSARDHLDNLDRRIQHVLDSVDSVATELAADIRGIAIRAANCRSACAERLEQAYSQLGCDMSGTTLPYAMRTLSPGDAGFQNVLLTPQGHFVMVDFEYAGWDDPAQLLGNACLHPTFPGSPEMKAALVRDLARAYGPCELTIRRLRAIYPILLLRWSLVLMNEFLPPAIERRRFARAASGGDAAVELATRYAESAEGILCGGEEPWWLSPSEGSE